DVTGQAGSISISGGTGQPPSVTVTFPNGGETLAAGTSTNITYTATDPDTDDNTLRIAVEYSTNSGATWSMIASDSGNSGSYPWTVPSVSTTQARVKVTASDGVLTGNDTSNSDFTITQQQPGDNVLIVGTATGTSGGQATVALSLDNDDIVKGIQLDIGYNASVVTYVSGSATGRAAGMSFSASVVGSAVRVIMYYSNTSTIAAGTGAIANLTFNCIGAGGTSTALTPTAMTLSDAQAQPLDVTGQAGSISISGDPGGAPVLNIFALKNPARPRTLQIFVSSDQTLSASPTVSAGSINVSMSLVDAVEHTYMGVVSLGSSQNSAVISATGTNGSQQGNASITVTF
ncbi:MAG: cohesin domain-containing protein, partial [Candidatus Eisenbacteria bacterium]|nr:cohesin domain-containing protein [Candidatus Eisenbacteria bacterium]